MTTFVDRNVTHDHSYYGNGCPDAWTASPTSGSQTPCVTRIVQTYDGENQKNGTSFSFQAATSGTGGTLATDNLNASDSFCPLGWQLPYDGTGGDYYDKSKSWRYLLISKYSLSNNIDSVNKIQSYPISFINNGLFNWNSGRLYLQGGSGYYWASSVSTDANAYRVVVIDTGIRFYESGNKANGDSIRCMSHYYCLSSTARWQERILVKVIQPQIKMIIRITEMDVAHLNIPKGKTALIKLARLE